MKIISKRCQQETGREIVIEINVRHTKPIRVYVVRLRLRKAMLHGRVTVRKVLLSENKRGQYQ